MTNYNVSSVDEFIQAAPEKAQPHLNEIRAAVQTAIPQAEEKIGYGKPYYKYHGWVVGFDVYQHHIGFEVWDGLPDSERESLEKLGYKTGSVTFQIKYTQSVPATIIQKLAQTQAQLNETKAAKKGK